MADETTDISIKEQLAVCIRYFNKEICKTEEHFIEFVDVMNLTDKQSHTIFQKQEKLKLDVTYCRDGFDGSSNLSG